MAKGKEQQQPKAEEENLITNEEVEEIVKIDKWDGSALKNTLDDTVKKFFNETLNYSEYHLLFDTRLALCLIAVGTALFALLYDYLNPFPLSRNVLIICVGFYFLLMLILTIYMTFVEKSIFLISHCKDAIGKNPTQVWTLSSNLKRFDDIYELIFEYNDGRKGTKTVTEKLVKSVADWFDVNGRLTPKFENDVKAVHDRMKAGKKE